MTLNPHLSLQAFVDFESSDEAARAIRERDHKVFSEKFGDRYVRLIQVCVQIPTTTGKCDRSCAVSSNP